MKPTRKLTSTIGMILAAALSITSCSTTDEAVNEDGSVNLSAVTLNVGDQAGIQQAILEASGVLDGAEYKVNWAQFPASAPLLEALKSQAVDVGYTGDAPFINAIASGADITAVAAGEAEGANGLALIVRNDSDIKSVADLRGKNVSPSTQGSVGHYLLLLSLEEAGVPLADVDISFLEPVNAAAAFKSGDIDAWATWDPYAALAEIDGSARVIRDAEGFSSKLGLLSGNNYSLEDPARRAAIIDFVGRFNTAVQWTHDNFDAYVGVYGGLTKRPRDVAALVAQRAQRTPVLLGQEKVHALQVTADNYLRFGVLADSVTIVDYVQDLSNITPK